VVDPYIGARLEGPKLEPEGLRAEMWFPTADQGFSSIQGTLLGFCGISHVFDDCNIYRTILVKLLTFVDFCVLLGVLAFG